MTKSLDEPEEFTTRVVAIIDAVDRLRAALAHSSFAVALQGAEVRQIRTGSADTKISTSAGRLMGWSIRETAGGTATLYLRDGIDADADIIVPVQLAPYESTRDSWFPGGLSFVRGLYVDIVSGSVEGAVYLGGAI